MPKWVPGPIFEGKWAPDGMCVWACVVSEGLFCYAYTIVIVYEGFIRILFVMHKLFLLYLKDSVRYSYTLLHLMECVPLISEASRPT